MKLTKANGRYEFLCEKEERHVAKDAGFRFSADNGRPVWWTTSARRALAVAAYADDELRAELVEKAKDEPDPLKITLRLEGTVWRYYSPDAASNGPAKNAQMRFKPDPIPHWWTESRDVAAKCFGQASALPNFVCSKEDQEELVKQIKAVVRAVEMIRATDAQIEITGLKKTLYPFQRAGVAFLAMHPRCFLGDEMGLGKTPQALAAIKARNGYPAIIICPASLKLNWQREALAWLPLQARDIFIAEGRTPLTVTQLNALAPKLIIINYDLLPTWHKRLAEYRPLTLVCDECFPYSTMVLTTIGYRPIGEIVDNGLNVYVASRNLSTGVLEWKPIRRWIRKPKPQYLLKVTHEHGSVTCTANHKIWTERGYARADSLTSDDYLCVVRNDGPENKAGQKHGTVLFKTVCEHRAEQSPGNAGKNARGNSQTLGRKTLSGMRWVISVSLQRQKNKSKPTVLRQLLCGAMAKPSAVYGSGQGEDRREAAWTQAQTESRVSQANARKQSDAQPRNGREDATKNDWTNLSQSWWKRTINRAAEIISRRSQFANGTCNLPFFPEGPVSISANSLQGRHRRPAGDGSDRGRRPQPQNQEVAFSRQAQDGCFERSRVVSVEVQKQRGFSRHSSVCPDGPFVYNLEVADHHNYIADGILVSNCHYLKNSRAQRTQAVYELSQGQIENVWLLSGTAIMNRPRELEPQLSILGKIEDFGGGFKFLLRYCDGHKEAIRVRGGKVKQIWNFSGASHLDELNQKLRAGLMIRRLKSEVLTDLPPKVRQVIEIDHPDRGMAAFEVSTWQKHETLRAELRAAVEIAKASDDPEEYANAIANLRAGEKASFEEVSKVRHDSAVRKIPHVVEHVKDLLEEHDKVVVWAHHQDVVSGIAAGLAEFEVVTLTGADAQEKRQAAVDAFQSGTARVFIGSIMAAGVGLTLTAANMEVFAELAWRPADISQAEDRCHRIGQRDVVVIHHLLFAGSIDAQMARTIIAKQDIIDKALDGTTVSELPIPEAVNEPEWFDAQLPAKEEASEPDDMRVTFDLPATSRMTVAQVKREAEKISPEHVALVYKGLRLLAGMCDGAASLDGTGFNRMDVTIGHMLASRPALSAAQACLGRKVLARYKNTQLKGVCDELWA